MLCLMFAWSGITERLCFEVFRCLGPFLRLYVCVLRHGFGHAVPLFRDSVYVRDAQYNADFKKSHNFMFTNAEYSLVFKIKTSATMRKGNTEKNIPKYTLLQVFMFSVTCTISSFKNYQCYCQTIFVLYNYDLWKIVKMEINHRSSDREKEEEYS